LLALERLFHPAASSSVSEQDNGSGIFNKLCSPDIRSKSHLFSKQFSSVSFRGSSTKFLAVLRHRITPSFAITITEKPAGVIDSTALAL
jgi:hypothetical protein